MSKNKDAALIDYEKRIESIMKANGLNREGAELYQSHIDAAGPVASVPKVDGPFSAPASAASASAPAAAAKNTGVVIKNNDIARLTMEFVNKDIFDATLSSLSAAGFKPESGQHSRSVWTINFDSNVETDSSQSITAYNDYKLTYNSANKNNELTFSNTKKAKAFFDIFHLNQQSAIFSLKDNKVVIKGEQINYPTDSFKVHIDFSLQMAASPKKAAPPVVASAAPAPALAPAAAVKAPQAAGLQSQQQATIYRAQNGSLAISFSNPQEAAGFFAKFSLTVPLEIDKKVSNNVCFLPLSSKDGGTGLYIANENTGELGINFSSKAVRDAFSKSLGLADHCKTFPKKEQKLFLKIEKLSDKSLPKHNFTASMPESLAPAKSRLCTVQ